MTVVNGRIMPKYLKDRPLDNILRDRKRKSVSLRIDSDIFDRIDMISIQENRSANYVVNYLLELSFLETEEEDGEIIVEESFLTQFRNRRKRSHTG